MTLREGKLSLWLIAGTAILIASFGIIAMVTLAQSNKRSRETEVFLYQLKANALGLNANEWEAIASLKIDPELRESSDHFRLEIMTNLEMIQVLQDRESFEIKVQSAVLMYLSAMDQEFALVSNGKFDEARELDRSRVDPSFATLSQAIQEAISTFEAETQRSSWTQVVSSAVILLACLTSILFLAARFERGRALQKNNARLQELVTQLSESREELIHASRHDSLTQLPNRTFFMDRLTHCVSATKKLQDYKFAVLFMDVDHFKAVNDSLGHLAGDHLIIQISERLIGSIRRDDAVSPPADFIGPVRPLGSDTLARLAGDKFAILLDAIRDASDGIRVAERIQRNLLPPFVINGHELPVTVSIGIAVSGKDYSVAEHVLRDADTAMRRARSLGRSRYQICDPKMHAAAVNRLTLENDLRLAEERGELKVYYQPIVTLENGCLSGFEALIRWQRPGFGLVPPGEFISVAEETGLIVPVGAWVLREACRQMHAWHVRFPSEPRFTIAVNFSAKQFIQPNLVHQVDQILRETQLDPTSLRIEFTESVAMQDGERTARILHELKALGLSTSIDDFGTGYSSLSYLSRLPLDILKLDRSFVSEMERNDESRQIVHTVISLAHNLRMDVVAEGIERVEQASELKSLGCKYAQGYFFSKPIDPPLVETLLNSGVRAGNVSICLLANPKEAPSIVA